MPEKVRTINLKEDLPTVEEARKQLINELILAKRQGVSALKLIHGYGSSGVGGKIKDGIRRSLALRKKEGKIKSYVSGEEWDIFEERSRDILEQCPELSGDSDLNRHNSGITIVLL